ncbi:hypothetical protein LXL04_034395 [Taraxacum kok-saghyz]
MSSSSSNVFSKLWQSRFKNTKGSEARAPEHESSDGKKKANQISETYQSSSDDGLYRRLSFGNESDEDDERLCSSDHKLNVSPVGYGSSGNMKFDQTKIRDLISGEADEDLASEDPNLEDGSLKLKNMKIKQIKSNDHNHRKSVHIRRKHGGKVGCYNSPRTVAKAACKIKAFEDMKKPLMKTKERVTEDAFRTGLDSFAIVKTSFDPQQDFRDSMIEMIMEKRLREQEELEELLSCYLTLNCDGYHNLIVKVFRQVWFELNHLHFDQHLNF